MGELHLPIGTLVNVATVVIGASLGLALHRGFPERFKRILLTATGLFTLALGAKMAIGYDNPLILVAALFLGALAGEALGIEAWMERMAEKLKRTPVLQAAVPVDLAAERSEAGEDVQDSAALQAAQGVQAGPPAPPVTSRFAEGLITAFLIFCVGPMTIVGALDEGLRGDHTLLLTKALMDLVSSFVLASTLGAGVLLSAVPLLIFQLGITLLGVLAAGVFSDSVTAALTAVGGVLIIGLGINLLELKKLRVANLLPALVFVVLLVELAAACGWS